MIKNESTELSLEKLQNFHNQLKESFDKYTLHTTQEIMSPDEYQKRNINMEENTDTKSEKVAEQILHNRRLNNFWGSLNPFLQLEKLQNCIVPYIPVSLYNKAIAQYSMPGRAYHNQRWNII